MRSKIPDLNVILACFVSRVLEFVVFELGLV
jgi:hypothetical protein